MCALKRRPGSSPARTPTTRALPLPCALLPGDRQLFFVNGRPVELPKAVKLLNQTYRSLSSPAAANSKPAAVVDIRCWGAGWEGKKSFLYARGCG